MPYLKAAHTAVNKLLLEGEGFTVQTAMSPADKEAGKQRRVRDEHERRIRNEYQS